MARQQYPAGQGEQRHADAEQEVHKPPSQDLIVDDEKDRGLPDRYPTMHGIGQRKRAGNDRHDRQRNENAGRVEDRQGSHQERDKDVHRQIRQQAPGHDITLL